MRLQAYEYLVVGVLGWSFHCGWKGYMYFLLLGHIYLLTYYKELERAGLCEHTYIYVYIYIYYA